MRSLLVLFVITATIAVKKDDCVPPPFLNRLPEDAVKQIQKIWVNYTHGEPCDAEKKATVAVLREVYSEQVFNVPKEVEGPIVDVFDMTPAFIRSLSPEIRKEFDAIWVSKELTDNDKHSRLEKLANDKFTEDQKTGFDLWLGAVKKAKAAMEERLKNLSPLAKEILKEMVQIRAAEEKIRQKITREIAKELEGLI